MPRVHLPDGRIVNFPDGMSAADISKAMDEIAAPKAAAPEPAQQGDLGRFAGYKTIGDTVLRLGKSALQHPIETGALVGGAVAAPLTGGASIPAAIAAAGLGGAGGAGLGMLANAIAGSEASPTTARGVLERMGTEGAQQAAAEGGGRLVQGGLRTVGRGMYRAAALPLNKMTKYGDLVTEGLENAVPISKSGLRKSEQLLQTRAANKAKGLADADQRVMLKTNQIGADARGNLLRESQAAQRAGLPDPYPALDKRVTAFENNNPAYMAPSEVDAVKGTLDNTIGGAYRKLRMREPITPSERYGVEMTQAQSRAIQDVMPEYRDLNRAKMNAEGLRQMIQRRVAPTGSGGNQGLENALTMLGGLKALPARLLMLPPVLSRAGIGAYHAGSVPVGNGLRAAMLAALGSDDQ